MSLPDGALDLSKGLPNLRPEGLFKNSKAWTRADFEPGDWMVPVTDAAASQIAVCLVILC